MNLIKGALVHTLVVLPESDESSFLNTAVTMNCRASSVIASYIAILLTSHASSTIMAAWAHISHERSMDRAITARKLASIGL